MRRGRIHFLARFPIPFPGSFPASRDSFPAPSDAPGESFLARFPIPIMLHGPRCRGRRGRSLVGLLGPRHPSRSSPFRQHIRPSASLCRSPQFKLPPPPPSAAAVLPVLSDAPPRRPHRQGPAWSRVPPVADCRTLLTRSDGLICTPATTSSPATDGPLCPRSSGSPRLPTPGRQPCSPLHPGHASNRTAFSRPPPKTSRSARAQLSRVARARRHRAPPPHTHSRRRLAHARRHDAPQPPRPSRRICARIKRSNLCARRRRAKGPGWASGLRYT